MAYLITQPVEDSKKCTMEEGNVVESTVCFPHSLIVSN